MKLIDINWKAEDQIYTTNLVCEVVDYAGLLNLFGELEASAEEIANGILEQLKYHFLRRLVSDYKLIDDAECLVRIAKQVSDETGNVPKELYESVSHLPGLKATNSNEVLDFVQKRIESIFLALEAPGIYSFLLIDRKTPDNPNVTIEMIGLQFETSFSRVQKGTHTIAHLALKWKAHEMCASVILRCLFGKYRHPSDLDGLEEYVYSKGVTKEYLEKQLEIGKNIIFVNLQQKKKKSSDANPDILQAIKDAMASAGIPVSAQDAGDPFLVLFASVLPLVDQYKHNLTCANCKAKDAHDEQFDQSFEMEHEIKPRFHFTFR